MALRIFDYLNVSNFKNLFADSGFWVQSNLIKYISREIPDVHFYLTIPKGGKDAIRVAEHFRRIGVKDHVTLVEVPYHAGLLNKVHFDAVALHEALNVNERDYDLVLCNEPTLVPSFFELFNHMSHFRIPVISYMHWIDLPGGGSQVGGNKTDGNHKLWLLLTGVRWSERARCNSEFGKRLLTQFTERWLSREQAEKISTQFKPLYLGIDTEELDTFGAPYASRFEVPTILFNHRISQYTGYDELLDAVRTLEAEGLKFKVIFTNPAPFHSQTWPKDLKSIEMIEESLSYRDYVCLLHRTHIVVGLHTGVNQWSLSLPEAAYCGNIPLMTDDTFYPEMFSGIPDNLKKALLVPRDKFTERLRTLILDADNMRTIIAPQISKYIAERYAWSVRAKEWAAQLRESYATIPAWGTDECTRDRIVVLFKEKPILRKSEIVKALSWGTHIKWTSYRLKLLKDYCIDDHRRADTYYELKKELRTGEYAAQPTLEEKGWFGATKKLLRRLLKEVSNLD